MEKHEPMPKENKMGESESMSKEGKEVLSYGKDIINIIQKLGGASENELTSELAKLLKTSKNNARLIVQKVLKKALAKGFVVNCNGCYKVPEFNRKAVFKEQHKKPAVNGRRKLYKIIYKEVIRSKKRRQPKKRAKKKKARKCNNNRRKKKR